MITRTTRRALIAAVGASVGAAAATVAVTPAVGHAAPTTPASQVTADQVAASFKRFVEQSRAAAARPATSSATASPNTTFPGDCDAPGSNSDPNTGLTVFFPTRSDGVFDCTLRRGDTDNLAVGKLQLALNDCYGQGLATDNDFGGLTQHAVINVQHAKNLKPEDGVYSHPLINANFQYPVYNSAGNFTHQCVDVHGGVYNH